MVEAATGRPRGHREVRRGEHPLRPLRHRRRGRQRHRLPLLSARLLGHRRDGRRRRRSEPLQHLMSRKMLVLISMFMFSHVSPAELPGDSIYQLESQWLTQDSKSIYLREFAGKKIVLSMTYTSCQHTCPTIVSNMQFIEKQLSEHTDDKVIFVLVSLMPETDTPKALKAYAKKRGLGGWILLSGSDDKVRTLAMVLDVKYKKAGEGDIAHSNLITILDAQGKIAHRISGVAENHDVAITYLNKI